MRTASLVIRCLGCCFKSSFFVNAGSIDETVMAAGDTEDVLRCGLCCCWSLCTVLTVVMSVAFSRAKKKESPRSRVC